LSDCPASQTYTLTLNKLAKKFKAENISFAGIFPGKFSSDDEMKEFSKTYNLIFPLLKDPEMLVVNNLGATIAPECFLIDNKGSIAYSGRIDDLYYSLGKKKQIVTENNLEDAITAVVKNLPLKIKKTKPIGCILEYDK
jgi:thiol-disulfide isomerase/thioredoxin